MNGPRDVQHLLRLRLAPLEFEVFGMLWLNAQNAIIAMEELFRGTVTQTSVYPREVIRRGLQLNAVAAIVYHNHPFVDSAVFTRGRCQQGLLLDHVVVSSAGSVSFAERGLM